MYIFFAHFFPEMTWSIHFNLCVNFFFKVSIHVYFPNRKKFSPHLDILNRANCLCNVKKQELYKLRQTQLNSQLKCIINSLLQVLQAKKKFVGVRKIFFFLILKSFNLERKNIVLYFNINISFLIIRH